jgi:DNA-binding MarR family transcriptional regulator
MSDTFPGLDSGPPGPLYLRDRDLEEALDLLIGATRTLTGSAHEALEKRGYGMAHFRVLHAISQNPAVPVARMLDILGIRKQSLHRLLTPLVNAGLVEPVPGEKDRRQRMLTLSEEGQAFVRELTEAARGDLARAFREAGPASVAGFRAVLRQLTGVKGDDAP